MPNRCSEEFDEDMANPLQDLSGTSEHSPDNTHFIDADDDINHLSNELSIPWETSNYPFWINHLLPWFCMGPQRSHSCYFSGEETQIPQCD